LRNLLGVDGVIDRCSTQYDAGQVTGAAAWIIGTAGASSVPAILPAIGRLGETAGYDGLDGFTVIADSLAETGATWSPEANAAWIQGYIDAGSPFYLASPLTEASILNYRNVSGFSVFADELSQILGAGYRVSGNWLVP
jgi:hypothetical protein